MRSADKVEPQFVKGRSPFSDGRMACRHRRRPREGQAIRSGVRPPRGHVGQIIESRRVRSNAATWWTGVGPGVPDAWAG